MYMVIFSCMSIQNKILLKHINKYNTLSFGRANSSQDSSLCDS